MRVFLLENYTLADIRYIAGRDPGEEALAELEGNGDPYSPYLVDELLEYEILLVCRDGIWQVPVDYAEDREGRAMLDEARPLSPQVAVGMRSLIEWDIKQDQRFLQALQSHEAGGDGR